ncbi:hypothetical protein IW261DRAFT_1614921 [Armillaria novae-zelandiae]|uniref:Uncharacterized protein n=1 Tax=Armillaria novae-zelandiae TaxID=153914 RepID=A0AA39KEX5_9AGAR|nr:hypothetical protein IW261DRAFT_1614921 [Armillaria novae-zelandiae]
MFYLRQSVWMLISGLVTTSRTSDFFFDNERIRIHDAHPPMYTPGYGGNSDDRSLMRLNDLAGVQARRSTVIDSLTFGGEDVDNLAGNEEGIILWCGDLRAGHWWQWSAQATWWGYWQKDRLQPLIHWAYNGVHTYVPSGNDTRRQDRPNDVYKIVRECRQE